MDYNAIVIGSGAAGLACAVRLKREGVKSVAVITPDVNSGTSRNTGSDKQTYYKLSLGGNGEDSVTSMAHDLYDAGGVNGYTALTEAANSARAFMFLAELGVPFAQNSYGEFPGYTTDNDSRARASSCGPLTSKYMTQALEAEARRLGADIIEGSRVVRIIADDNRVHGVIALDKAGEFTVYSSPAAVLACGGEASLYSNSVFPASQWGGMGLAVQAGAALSNMNCWQYGIASKEFRWNLSGSYMQAVPRILFTGSGCATQTLTDKLGERDAVRLTFLKGYEWPFDVRKAGGSSLIDLHILAHTQLNGGKVYLDYTGDSPLPDSLNSTSPEVYSYLKNCAAFESSPAERLRSINEKAYRLMLDNGIDLCTAPLPIHVAAQHQSGGAAVDEYYETSVHGLFAIGEAAGCFGAYRPGGSALNSGQVGALRAAVRIRQRAADSYEPAGAQCASPLRNAVDAAKSNGGVLHSALLNKIRAGFDSCACLVRDVDLMQALYNDLTPYTRNYFCTVSYSGSALEYLMTYDTLLTACSTLSAMLLSAREQGSTGSALVCKKSDILTARVQADEDKAKMIVSTRLFESTLTAPAPLPERELWFERLLGR